MSKMTFTDSPIILSHIDTLEGMLKELRALEHNLLDDALMDEFFEEHIIHLKLNIKAMKKQLYALNDTESMVIEP